MYEKLKAAYIRGDEIGAVWEGKQRMIAPNPDDPRHGTSKPGGTDEAETIRCWEEYDRQRYGAELSPLAWATYFATHSRPATWGNTYPDFFRLTRYCMKQGRPLDYGKLVEISASVMSKGNGCLALVLPLVHSCIQEKLDPRAEVLRYTIMTHAHPEALAACLELTDILVYGEVPAYLRISEDAGIGTAMSTLRTSIALAQDNTLSQVIEDAIWIGGDTDSILALAMMLYTLKNGG